MSTAAALDPPHRQAPTPDWQDFVAPTVVRQALQRLVDEHRHRSQLAPHGLVPRRRVLLVGPPDCGQSFVVDRLARLLDAAPQILSFEAWAAQAPSTQWAALDAWAASGSLLVLRHGQIFSQPSEVLRATPAARLFLAWWDQAPAGPFIVARDAPARPNAREITRAFPDIIALDPPTPAFMEAFVRARFVGWPVSSDAIVRLRQPTVGFSFGDLARMVANAQKASLMTPVPLEQCLIGAMVEEQRRIREV